MRSHWSYSLAIAGMALLLCGVASGIDTRQSMPNFRATALDGQKYDNASVKGKVVLLQFWATWCKYCRGDQDAVDTVAKEFAEKGLIVLAVDAGEPKRTVKQYLAKSPRAVPVVLMENTNLAAMFDAKGYPLYVLIDADGKIAGELRRRWRTGAPQSSTEGRAGISHSANRVPRPRIFLGSSLRFTARIFAISSVLYCSSNKCRLRLPRPCSADTVPPNATAWRAKSFRR